VIGQIRGDYRQSAEALSRLGEVLQGDRRYERLTGAGPGRGSVNSGGRLAWCLAELGEFAEATAQAEEAIRIASEVDHLISLAFSYRSLGFVFLRRGAIPQAIAPLERAVELCRVAVRVLFDITAAVARRALDLAHRQKERGNEAWALRLLAEIAARADPPDVESADAHYRQALARTEELGMRPLAAHCHLGLGKLYRRTGQREQARDHLTIATTMYREMGMTFWLEQAEAAIGPPRGDSP